MNDIQYYKQVLNNICLDLRDEAIQGTICIWIVALLCFVILYVSYKNTKKKHLAYQHKRCKSSHKKRKKSDNNSASFYKLRDGYIIGSIVLIVLFITFQIMFCAGTYQHITKIRQDITNETFETYSGTFSVNYVGRIDSTEITGNVMLSNDFLRNSPDCKIYDLYNKKDIYSDYIYITYGTYYGKVVFGQYSKFVVYWSLE